MCAIGASATEELDLLFRWSGSSFSQINSFKSANAEDPEVGLACAWDRLHLQLGSPERVEQALRAKLNNCQRITFKDKTKMYKLFDILAEIRAVKEKVN